MCGIVGIAIKSKHGFTVKQEDIFYELLFADTLRGEDSTGIVVVENDGGFGYAKEAYSAPWCVDELKKQTALKGVIARGKVMIGHNRKATVGKISAETAHPFVVDNKFIMVHNGTLHGHRLLAQTDVDSEALAQHLAPILNETLDVPKMNEALGDVYGAYAIAAYSQPQNKIFLLRNSQRPLFFVETDTFYAWASEGAMLQWILSRNGVDLKKVEGEFVKEHQLLSIDLDTNELSREDLSPKKIIATSSGRVTGHTGGSTPSKPTTSTKSVVTAPSVFSKAAFKRLRRQVLNGFFNFWVDDYIEKNLPKTIAEGETELLLLGQLEHDDFPSEHTVRAEVDLKHIHMEGDGVTERFFTGRIYHMEMSKISGTITVFMDRVQPVPKALSEYTKGKVYGPKELAKDLEKLEMNNASKNTLH